MMKTKTWMTPFSAFSPKLTIEKQGLSQRKNRRLSLEVDQDTGSLYASKKVRKKMGTICAKPRKQLENSIDI